MQVIDICIRCILFYLYLEILTCIKIIILILICNYYIKYLQSLMQKLTTLNTYFFTIVYQMQNVTVCVCITNCALVHLALPLKCSNFYFIKFYRQNQKLKRLCIDDTNQTLRRSIHFDDSQPIKVTAKVIYFVQYETNHIILALVN